MADEPGKDSNAPEKTIAEDLVVTKYKMAGEIVNRVLKQVLLKCVSGASVRQICIYGDQLIAEETGKTFKREKDLKKGVAFPTCVSANNCICHFSPVQGEPDCVLRAGDVAKVDLGAHIDGFIAVVAHTIIVPSANPQQQEIVKGRKADVLMAAHYASQAALRLLKPGTDSSVITSAIQKIAAAYECKPVEGMLSHQLKQFRIDADKTIIQNPNEAQRKEHEKCVLDTHEVYAMDVLISTGEGVGKETDTKCSIYKKTDETYQLKLKASRAFYTEVRQRHGSMPFNLRSFDEESATANASKDGKDSDGNTASSSSSTKAKMGVVECLRYKLVEPFQVLYETKGELVAHFKFTVLLMPGGAHKITGLPFDVLDLVESEHSIEDEELRALLSTSANPKANKKKKKKTTSEKQQPMEGVQVEGEEAA